MVSRPPGALCSMESFSSCLRHTISHPQRQLFPACTSAFKFCTQTTPPSQPMTTFLIITRNTVVRATPNCFIPHTPLNLSSGLCSCTCEWLLFCQAPLPLSDLLSLLFEDMAQETRHPPLQSLLQPASPPHLSWVVFLLEISHSSCISSTVVLTLLYNYLLMYRLSQQIEFLVARSLGCSLLMVTVQHGRCSEVSCLSSIVQTVLKSFVCQAPERQGSESYLFFFLCQSEF